MTRNDATLLIRLPAALRDELRDAVKRSATYSSAGHLVRAAIRKEIDADRGAEARRDALRKAGLDPALKP